MYLQASGQLSVDTSHSSIGSTCGNSNCASSNLGLILRTGQHACRQNSHSMLSACTEQTSLASSSCLLCTGHSHCCHDSTYMLYWGKPEHPSIPVRLLNYVVLNCTCPEIHDVSTRTCAGLKGGCSDCGGCHSVCAGPGDPQIMAVAAQAPPRLPCTEHLGVSASESDQTVFW